MACLHHSVCVQYNRCAARFNRSSAIWPASTPSSAFNLRMATCFNRSSAIWPASTANAWLPVAPCLVDVLARRCAWHHYSMPPESLSIPNYAISRSKSCARGSARCCYISASRTVSRLEPQHSCLFPGFDLFGTHLPHSHSRLGANTRVTSELGQRGELS